MSNTAIVAQKVGEFGDVLAQKDSTIPKATGRDIVVKNIAAATNPVDFKRIAGAFTAPDAKDFIVGYDSAGVVEAVGDEASLFKVGDEVYFSGSVVRDGTFQDYTVVDERIVGPKPKSISFDQAAAFPLVTITAWEALVEELKIQKPVSEEEKKSNKEKVILIVNGAGGVGSVAIQLASKVFGLTVVATASRPDTIKWVTDLGADHVVNHHKPYGPQFEELGIKGAHYALVNTELTSEVLAAVVEVVRSRGAITTLFPDDLTKANWMALFSRRISLSFEMMFQRSLENDEPEKQNELLAEVSALIDAGVVVPIDTKSFPFTLDGVRDALSAQASGKTHGKIVLSRK